INIGEDDELIEVRITSGEDQIFMATRQGMAIRFEERDARPMGRATAGVRGIKLRKGDECIGMVVAREGSTILTVSENGLGKRTEIDEYRLQKRGGYGVINLKLSSKTGEVVAIRAVEEDEQLMMITRKGVVNRQRVEEIRVIGRATQGVKLMNLDEGDVVVDVARIVPEEGEDAEDAEVPAGAEGELDPQERTGDHGFAEGGETEVGKGGVPEERGETGGGS
ncbi:MAG: DNA gyrase C-terminal beta-propeller domain-containing protein, partial [Longimicrobiales bacterium]|nr:DNA gyrase C-terminal beta-propeller domain-containing protein [Longimicrobiales bacterium]